jgi:hypothetical protein
MNRAQRRSLASEWNKTLDREAKKVIKNSLSDRWTDWEKCPNDDTPFLWAWKNNKYVVMGCMPIKTEIGYLQRAIIRHNTGNPIHSWRDIQRIKNEIFGEEAHAVEYYPKQSELIDEKNVYHLWVLESNYKAPFSFEYKFEVNHES